MAYQELTTTAAWPDAAQYTSSGATEVRIVNPVEYGVQLFWVTNATKPTLTVKRGSPIPIGGVQDLTLADGEKLWIAAPNLVNDTVLVTLLT